MPGSLWRTKLHSKHNIWCCPHFSTVTVGLRIRSDVFSCSCLKKNSWKIPSLLVWWEGNRVQAQTWISLQTKHYMAPSVWRAHFWVLFAKALQSTLISCIHPTTVFKDKNVPGSSLHIQLLTAGAGTNSQSSLKSSLINDVSAWHSPSHLQILYFGGSRLSTPDAPIPE